MPEPTPFATGALPKSARDNHSLLSRATKADIRKTIASRLLASREINGYSQTDAAAMFGYKTPAQLSQWEQCRRMPPLQMLVRAAGIYRVSLDYLMGVSEEPDRDPASVERAAVLAGAQEMFASASSVLAETILSQMKTGGPAAEIAFLITEEATKYHTAVARFMELNRVTFEEDMRGSNVLVGMHERFATNCLAPAQSLLDRFRRLSEMTKKKLKSAFRPADLRIGLFDQTGA